MCNPKIGDICIVECERQLFRCEIVDIIDGKKPFIISYVDYGEEQELDGDFLYAVDNQEEVRDFFNLRFDLLLFLSVI